MALAATARTTSRLRRAYILGRGRPGREVDVLALAGPETLAVDLLPGTGPPCPVVEGLGQHGRGIREQCITADVAFFFKQWDGVFKSRTGRELDGPTWDQMLTREGVETILV